MSARVVTWIELWDGRYWPGRIIGGLPAFEWQQAPAGLLTRRQLRGKGLALGGQEPFARLVWKRDIRWAWLYVEDRAHPKRVATAAQLAAVGRALAARRVCVVCGPVSHCVRTTDGLCGDCYAAGGTPPARARDWSTAGGAAA